MNRELELEIRRRGGHLCEYCHMPQACANFKHPIDHVISRQHHGPTVVTNLALCCADCNRYKGPNLSGIDPSTGQVTALFNPRSQSWREHFRWQGPYLLSNTDTGRTTIDVLA